MLTVLYWIKNSGDKIKDSIRSLQNSTAEDYNILIVESGSTDGTAEYCDQLATYLNIKVLHTKPRGPLFGLHEGINAIPQGDILLIHDDVIVHPIYRGDWLTIMKRSAEEEDVGLIIPSNGGAISGPEYQDGFIWAGTWFTYLTRRALNKVENIDLKFAPGMGEDIDLTYRINQAGLRTKIEKFWVEHHRHGEKPQDADEKQIKKNGKYFRKKHGIK